MSFITLTTDFGLSDAYVAVMKGVILSINPDVRIIDISHNIKAGHIAHAGYVLKEACPFFPKGTIHVAVVDPGVGNARRPVIVITDDYFFVGPDNGIFWPIITTCGPSEIIHLTKPEFFLSAISKTFHGRDIFAPVAAHLSKGYEPKEMGLIIKDPVKLEIKTPRKKGNILFGEVIRVDHFGNIITNISKKVLGRFLKGSKPVIKAGDLIIKDIVNSYSEAGMGEALVLIGSSNYLEIAVNRGRAADFIGIAPYKIMGTEIEVRRNTNPITRTN
ncbi:MAG: hypothetical protein B1H11_11805 [Desulfobacteraceae bacterium 4484_190.1]|nr:MAG: hypothetical protein B1H11_11805 [Desulfobacteraceae bacterium 4484_190.1]